MPLSKKCNFSKQYKTSSDSIDKYIDIVKNMSNKQYSDLIKLIESNKDIDSKEKRIELF